MLHLGLKPEIRDLATGGVVSFPFHPRDEYNWETNFSGDGSLLLTTSAGEALVNLWATSTGQSAAEFTLRLPTSIRGALSPGGTQVVIGTAQGAIHRLRVGRGAARPLVLPRLLPAMPLAFFPESPARLLWMASDRTRVLDVASGREMKGGFAFPRVVTEAAPGEGSTQSPLRADLKFLVLRNGPGWEAWELSLDGGVPKMVPLRDAPPGPGRAIFSPAGDWVALTNLNKIAGTWNLRTGARIGPAINEDRMLWPFSVNFSPDGRRLAAAYAGAAGIWDVASGNSVTSMLDGSPEAGHIRAQFSPSGTRIVTASRRGEARVWHAVTGEPLSTVLYHNDGLSAAVFSPDERYFVTRSSTEARVWDANTNTLVGEPIAIPGGRDLRFSPDGRRFITASEGGNACIFDVRTAQAFTAPMNHGPVRLPTAYFSPDGLFVRTETTASDFRIWSVPPATPDGTPTPEWLLQLATVCAGKVVNEQGQLTPVTDTAEKIAALRLQIAALPANAPLADWGRWILDNRADRSIAPGFTLTPDEADRLLAKYAPPAPTTP